MEFCRLPFVLLFKETVLNLLPFGNVKLAYHISPLRKSDIFFPLLLLNHPRSHGRYAAQAEKPAMQACRVVSKIYS